MDIKRIVVGPIEVNCYLFVSGIELAVVDPGDEAEKIIEEIGKLGKVDYKYVLLTHGHYDHVMAVNELKDKYGFKVVIGEKDADISGMNAQIGVQTPKTKVDITVKDGQVLDFGGQRIQVLETPGHTIGSVSYLIGTDLFSGDTLFRHTHGRTDLPGGSDEDMGDSLEKLLKLNEKINIHPGHGEETTVEEEREFFKNHQF
ncbi:MAG: MBL fold metallo-hydrolase [bacterium]|nr:MBL fold metallo-hydrolase [bacterium]